MKFALVTLLTIGFVSISFAGVKTLEEVLEQRLSTASEYTSDLSVVAGRDRIRAWLPTAPELSYSSNDNHTWLAWSVSTSLPIPLKSLYRDDVEVAKKNYLQSAAVVTKQDLMRQTIENFLECSVPSEMSRLLEMALSDQKVVSTISNSLYASGSVPQADRVAAELLARQMEAQVRLQKNQAINGCRRWEKWADEKDIHDDPVYAVPVDVSNSVLNRVGLSVDPNRDMSMKKLLSLSLSKEKLWSKYVPDLDFTIFKNNYFDLIQSGGPPFKHSYSWTVGIKLPFTFPFYDNTDFKREKAELGLDKMQAELDRNNADKKWMDAKSDWMRTTARLREIWDKDLALAEVLVESSLASYRAGKVGFADLVLARRTRLDLKVEEIQLKAQRLVAKTVCLTECEL